jgi:hypothetical protein
MSEKVLRTGFGNRVFQTCFEVAGFLFRLFASEVAMHWTFEYDERANLVRVNVAGKFSLEGHSKKMDELETQDYWKPGINVLFDCREVDLSDTGFADIKALADNFVADDRLLGCSKIALLMKTITDYGRGRQFEMLTDEKMCADIRNFMDEKQAVRWAEG